MNRCMILIMAAMVLLLAWGSPIEGVVVSTTGELVNAVNNANSGGDKTVIIQDGTYYLTSHLPIWADGMTFRSQSGNRDSVIIRGQGMYGSVTHIFNVAGTDFTVRDMTIGWVSQHAIQIWGNNNSSNTVISNLHIVDAYEQMVKISYEEGNPNRSENGLMENCLVEYSAGVGPNWYIGGIDGHQTSGWVVRNNTFKYISSPAGDIAEHAVHFWSESEDTVVENNLIIDCDRGIGFGLGSRGHVRGTIRNNMIYHSTTNHGFADAGICLENASNVQVYNNTIYLEHDFDNSIEYRFSGTAGGIIYNNLSNKLIRSRDGGSASLATNVTNAQTSWFADTGMGDLHLASSVPAVVDQGTAISGFNTDYDGDFRPNGSGIDIGADEMSVCKHPDFNRDGRVDILWRNRTTFQNGVWYMNNNRRTGITFLPSLRDASWVLAGSADFNNDGKSDMVWRNISNGQNGVWFMDNEVRTGYSMMPSLNTDWELVGVADFNSDGKPDLFWRHKTTGQNGVWFMNGTSRTGYSLFSTLNTDWAVGCVADFNSDGKPDIVWRHKTTCQSGIWYMNGVIRTGQAFITSLLDADWEMEAAADFNNDGHPDFLWRHRLTGENGIWYMNGVTRTGYALIPTLSNTDWDVGN